MTAILTQLRLCLKNHLKSTFETNVLLPTDQNSCFCIQFVFPCIKMHAQHFQSVFFFSIIQMLAMLVFSIRILEYKIFLS